ncbi:acyl CoA:acetate/3-ketoacid CoA transferase [Endozoicomonas sp. SM1973]|uniref:Acetate CoA-transferase YdiF n=1 Tax=Spartinivicinus marinus TaxID=2994442 RepID=A0A853I6I2_9GAMM|nr:acyl CoA:acetate/3-ketoacid CoA transferase [Spartinivicinus marinus]MCX4029931.1 acyl CoA:acetate/3-ketoacid CoA transferase [Spartinivicinus marinus]NYZ64825.1 acyl CoA:acetate/3-ketoacid CoA transferase [Spartinivicinus marinus]
MSKQISFEQAAQLINDRDVVTVSSSSGLGCPDRMLQAIGERFDREGHPTQLTTLHPIAAGDMYGIKGVDYLAKPGLLDKVIAGSYPSGPSSLPMPAIWKEITENRITGYNIPSGILFDMHREAAAKRPGVMTRVGIDTFVDPDRQGGAMNDKAAANPIVRKLQFEGEEYLFFPSITPNVAIIRATSADQKGNLSFEQEGAYLGGLEQALAVRNNGGVVIAQVKRVVSNNSLSTYQVHIPGNLVDAIVVDPEQLQTTQTLYDPAISGVIRRPDESFTHTEFSPEKVIARRVAQELKAGQAVNLGFGISANVPRILLEEGLHGEVTWVVEQGAVGGIPLLGFAFGCAANADSIIPSPQQFTYFQGGGFDQSFLSFMEVDQQGNVNVSKLGIKPYLTAGCGGFVDITAHAKKIVFSGFFTAGAKYALGDGKIQVALEGRFQKFVKAVEHVTFSGKMAIQRDQQVLYVTERCVMQLTPEGIEVIELAPGIDLERDVLSKAGFPLKVADNLTLMDAALFEPAPFGLQLG